MTAMLADAGIEPAFEPQAAEFGSVAEVIDVVVEASDAEHSVVTLRLDVPSAEADRWQDAHQLEVFAREALER